VARDRLLPAAMVCAMLANIHRDQENHPELYTPADFLPGAATKEDEMREFAEAVARGDKFEVDPEQVAAFRREMVTSFKNVRGQA
jgi:hypothetical protein